jgi:hypothetical protein
VETDESLYPVDISLLRPYAVVQVTDAFAQLIENLHRTKSRESSSDVFHDLLLLYIRTE